MKKKILSERGDRLKKVREYLKLTQAQLGESIGLLGYHVRDMESGKVELSTPIAKLLYHEFGANSEYLLDGKGGLFIDQKKERPGIVPEKIMLILKDMDEKEQREVLKHLEEKKLFKELLEERKKKQAG